MKQYITSQGDTFDIIAKKFYGNEIYTKNLLNENIKYADIVIFANGVILNIPEIDTTQTPQSLSPWRES